MHYSPLKLQIMKNCKIISIFTISLFFISCNQSEEYFENEQPETLNYECVSTIEEVESNAAENECSVEEIKFTYRGQTFSGKCTFKDKIQIEDKNVQSLFDKLNNTPNIAIAINPDSSIEFYDSFEELDNANKFRMAVITRGSVDNGDKYIKEFKIKLWDKAKGRKKGGISHLIFSNGVQGEKSPAAFGGNRLYLERANLYKKISSIQMWAELGVARLQTPMLPHLWEGQYQTAAVTFYENGDFTGKSLTFNEITIKYTYSERDYFSGFGFDNLAGSLKINYY